MNQLEQRFHRPQRTKAGVGRDIDAVGVDGERITFIAVGQGLRGHFFSDRDANGGFIRIHGLRLKRPAGLQRDALA
ncbi:hypothetical protein D3C78_1709870 [compost metagenome]